MGRVLELDGLRGIAVLIIILSHFESSILSSGGVNIFFVVSGFLITKIIFSEGINFNIYKFYFTRLNSLYPQLILSVLVISIIFLFIGDFNKLDIFFISFLSSISSTMNLYLIDQGNIYENQAYINLFMPLWAFSVIIQFYIIYPIFIKCIFFIQSYFSVSNMRNFQIFICVTISLYVFYLIAYVNGSELGNFYALTSRLWQFLFGACAYFCIINFNLKYKEYFLIIGISLIMIWQLFPSEINFFYTTLIITLATCLIIISFFQNKEEKRIILFSSPISIGLGKISYPLYIWHMPIIYFSSLYFDEVYVIVITLIFGISIAYIQYKLNDKYILKNSLSIRNLSKKTTLISISIAALSIILLTNFYSSQFASDKLSNFENNYNYHNHLDKQFEQIYDGHERSIIKNDKGETCQKNILDFSCKFNETGSKSEVILIGTSHLAALSASITNRLITNDHPVTILTSGGCPYMLDFYHFDRVWCNEEYMEKIRSYLSDRDESSVVIYLIRYAYYMEEKMNSDPDYHLNIPTMLSKSDSNIFQGLTNTLNDILNLGHKLVMIYPVPEIGKNVPKEYRKKIYNKNYELYLPYKKFLDRNSNIIHTLNSIDDENAYHVLPENVLCEDKTRCITKINKKILYNDTNHLSVHGSELIAPIIFNLPIFKTE